MYVSTRGLVLREVRYKEADRILTVYTENEGKITAVAHGALSKKNRLASATQQLTYSEFVLDYRNGRYSVKEAMVIDGFDGLRTDISSLALGCYFSECIDSLCPEDLPDPEILRLGLNCLYALSRELYSQERIKAVFELKLMSRLGYEPDLSSCAVCSEKEPETAAFCYTSGRICCRTCHRPEFGSAVVVSGETLKAMRYTISADSKRFLSFKLDRELDQELSSSCEKYICDHSGRTFNTLEYWKKVK